MTIACPIPIATTERVQLGHGSGGKMSAALIRDRFLPHLGNDILAQLGDAAIVTSPVNRWPSPPIRLWCNRSNSPAATSGRSRSTARSTISP
jgi:hypothetical protein